MESEQAIIVKMLYMHKCILKHYLKIDNKNMDQSQCFYNDHQILSTKTISETMSMFNMVSVACVKVLAIVSSKMVTQGNTHLSKISGTAG